MEMHKNTSIVKLVKAGIYLGAVLGRGCAGLTEERREELCFKGEEGDWGSSLRGMNANTLEGNPKSLYIMQKGSSHILSSSSSAGDSQPREQTGAGTITVLREASELDLMAWQATILSL